MLQAEGRSEPYVPRQFKQLSLIDTRKVQETSTGIESMTSALPGVWDHSSVGTTLHPHRRVFWGFSPFEVA